MPSRTTATIESSHQWWPVAETASVVRTRCSRPTQRHGSLSPANSPNETTAAQAMWTEASPRTGRTPRFRPAHGPTGRRSRRGRCSQAPAPATAERDRDRQPGTPAWVRTAAPHEHPDQERDRRRNVGDRVVRVHEPRQPLVVEDEPLERELRRVPIACCRSLICRPRSIAPASCESGSSRATRHTE